MSMDKMKLSKPYKFHILYMYDFSSMTHQVIYS